MTGTARDILTLTIERPAVGGRMIARHDGAVALVAGAIPGEVVAARVEKVQRGTIWARTERVLEPSPDRVSVDGDVACGGSVYAHIAYARQLAIKQAVIRDALTRIGKLTAPDDIPVASSPIDGYRMRARLHVRNGAIGYFREGTHRVCDPRPSRQLLPETLAVVQTLGQRLAALLAGAEAEVEIAENLAASERGVHVIVPPAIGLRRLATLAPIDGVTGLSSSTSEGGRIVVVSGEPAVSDRFDVGGGTFVTLTRQPHAFFQANRFLVPELVTAILAQVPEGPVVDLYAGVGLFAVRLAARGQSTSAVEGDPVSAADLARNAAQCEGRLDVSAASVEQFLTGSPPPQASVILDPPRTGMSAAALDGVVRWHPPRLVYLSCDVATLARDARRLMESGYRLSELRAFDLFPQTAHIETLAIFDA